VGDMKINTDGVFLGSILETGGMEMLLWTVESFQVFGNKMIWRVFYRSASIFLRKLRFPDDYLVEQVHYARRRGQFLYSVNSADNIFKYANTADEDPE
jgi:hypothetical protein